MPPKQRVKSPPPPKKLHETLLDPTTELGFISDNSSYSFVLYGKRAQPIEVNGISFTQFCMKITIVGTQQTVYDYTTVNKQHISKYISTKEAIEKEVRLQKRLNDNFRKEGRRLIVPYVIHECLLSIDEFSRLFSERTLDDNVMNIIRSIQDNMSRRVHIFFMEYMDNTKYKTLEQCLSSKVAPVYQRMAAILACAAGCNVIPYDAYEPNIMLDACATDVRLIDLGNTFDLPKDKTEIVGLFDEMLKKTVGVGDSVGQFPTIDQFNAFFDVTSGTDHLSKAFNIGLTSFIDLRKETNLTVENIHRNLMMLAFIDFMINRFGLLDMRASSSCKCRYAMESVYGEGSFANFGTFLTTFRSYAVNDAHRAGLNDVMGLIQQILDNQPFASAARGSNCSILGGGGGIKPTIIKRYLPDTLSIRDKSRQRKELTKSRRLYKQGKYYTRKAMRSFKSKPSKHLDRARSLYHVDKIRPSRELSRKTGCSLKGLRQIVKKGEGAYYSSGSRPNQTPQSWGNARLASAITGGNASLVDFHILDKECDHRKPAFRLAQKPRK